LLLFGDGLVGDFDFLLFGEPGDFLAGDVFLLDLFGDCPYELLAFLYPKELLVVP